MTRGSDRSTPGGMLVTPHEGPARGPEPVSKKMNFRHEAHTQDERLPNDPHAHKMNNFVETLSKFMKLAHLRRASNRRGGPA